MVPLIGMPDFIIAYSNVILKRRHASASPFPTSLCIMKGAESLDWILIWICKLYIIILTNLINFSGTFSSFMATYICSLSMLSYALLKSIKSRSTETQNYFILSKTCHNPKILFIVDFLGETPPGNVQICFLHEERVLCTRQQKTPYMLHLTECCLYS